ncbi:hypothetical protein PoB_006293900 [Plakobranchus ocellatus]|uniref:Uncharacterized protein n=1 Tax=Plakobranchus ocellatus TaxID=259542 RepID=A0AAV4CX17_9GAST|nr:hypothetical protein PoB_006293900 [Plakobranchus ocellatus]
MMMTMSMRKRDYLALPTRQPADRQTGGQASSSCSLEATAAVKVVNGLGRRLKTVGSNDKTNQASQASIRARQTHKKVERVIHRKGPSVVSSRFGVAGRQPFGRWLLQHLNPLCCRDATA